MNAKMREYRDRWGAVAEIERQELQEASFDERWQQLNSLMCLAIGLGIMTPDKNDVEVNLQWEKLRNRQHSLKPPV